MLLNGGTAAATLVPLTATSFAIKSTLTSTDVIVRIKLVDCTDAVIGTRLGNTRSDDYIQHTHATILADCIS
jgi:hypothetical protein